MKARSVTSAKNAIRYCESGTALFYTLLILPVAMTVTILAVDVSGWNALRDVAQREADRIALQAAHALPDINLARTIVEQASISLPQLALVPGSPIVTSSSVRVALRGQFQASFDIFLSSAGHQQQVFAVERSSTAQVVPSDYVLILSDGRGMRPQVGEASWANSAWWPASGYFSSCAQAPSVNEASSAAASWDWSSDELRRWATQSCFNPALSALKLAAISLVDSVASIETNRIGVLFTPGRESDGGLTALRYIFDRPSQSRIGGFPENTARSAQAHWPVYVETESLLGDEACMLFSDERWDTRYALPQAASPGLPALSAECGDTLSFLPCGEAHLPYGWASSCFTSSELTLRQAIYWHAAKLQTATFTAEPNLPLAIDQALIELRSGTASELAGDTAKRGNLALQPQQLIIVISDFLPDPADPVLQAVVTRVKQARASLIVTAFSHPWLSPTDEQVLATRIDEYRNLAQTLGRTTTASPVLQVYQATTAEMLTEQLAPQLSALKREVILQS